MRFLLICCCLHFFVLTGQQSHLQWKFLHPISKKWFPLGEKGSVQEALIKAGELPDPFVGLNESRFAWIEEYQWEFQSEFHLSPEELQQTHIDLELPNVDTYAKVYVNDQYLGTTENSFVIYRYDIKKWVKPGKNEVKLVFEPPISYQAPLIKKSGVELPAPNDVGKIHVAPYCRKPQYQFGWDWAERMITIGLWKPATIKVFAGNRVTAVSKSTAELNKTTAIMDFQLQLRYASADSLKWISKQFGTITVLPSDGKVIRREQVDQPELWWPRGQGKQFLYEDEWILATQSGEVIYKDTVRYGIRKAELIMEPDRWGTSYTIRVNGRDMFCKGANYIPQSIFPASVTDESLRETVRLMHDSNFNIVRVWGGGYYQPEAFYNACDELGIMVWQDFMFACAMYPGDDAFLKNVKTEFDQQIPRLASHPSVVLFNGNNEVDVAWKNWGFQSQYKISAANQSIIMGWYDKLFKGLLPERIAAWTTTPYIHTSPLSNWGKDEYFNSGSMHYWGVWHGKDPIEDFGRKTGRFNAEYGFQSFPEYATLLTFCDTSEMCLESTVMMDHQKSYVGNGMIARHSNSLFGETTDFQRFIYYSQLTQSEAISMAISGHRTDMPRCSGTIFWQFNDCWPAPTWSSIDYFGNWKALQYTVRDDYRDVAIVAKRDTLGKERYHLVSDDPDDFSSTVQCEILDLDGNLLGQWSKEIAVKNELVQELFAVELAAFKSKNQFIRFQWNDKAGNKLERNFTHLPVARKPIERSEVTVELIIVDSNSAVLYIDNKGFVRKFWTSSLKQGVRFDQNFIDLLPGKHTIHIQFREPITLEDLRYTWL